MDTSTSIPGYTHYNMLLFEKKSDCMEYETLSFYMYTLFKILCSAVPTSASTFSSSANMPSVTVSAQGSITAPVAAGVTVSLLLLLIVSIAVILGLLWVKRRRRMKAAERSIPLEIMSW